MNFTIPDLHNEHPALLAGRLMLEQWNENEMMHGACKHVLKRFPELTPEQVMCLWIGVNMAQCSIEDLEKIELVELEN